MIKKKIVYIAVAADYSDAVLSHGAVAKLSDELAALGFTVHVQHRYAGQLPPFEPCGLVLSEHSLSRHEAYKHEGPTIRPALANTIISNWHPLQVSVIGHPGSGKTSFLMLINQWIGCGKPIVLSLDGADHELRDISHVNDVIGQLAGQVEIHIRQLNIRNSGVLSDFFF